MSYIMHFNKNHDKLGRFTFGKGSSVSEKKSPDSYRTSELDSKYKAYKDAKVSEFYERTTKLPWVESDDDNAEEAWGKDVVKIADIGLEGLGWLNPGDIDDNSERSWFLFEDQTIGMPEIAYLASQGKSVKEIVDMINSVNDCEHQNNEFLEQYREEFHKNRKVYDEAEKKLPYPDAYYCGFTEYGRTDEKDEFINGCVEAAKKMEHSDSSDSLAHFNPNHDPKTGQFTFSKDTPKTKAYDGVRDRFRQQKEKKKEYISEGYKKSYARRYARDTSNIKIGLSKQYNKYVKDNIRFNKKSEKYAEKGKEEKAELWAKRAVLAYQDAKLTEAYIDQAAELGRVFCTTLATEYAKGFIVGNLTASRLNIQL